MPISNEEMIATGFSKRIFTLGSFLASTREVLTHRRELRAASGRVDGAFSEKIMLAVTKVNGCRYCSYGHSRAALSAGVSRDELRQILDGDFAGLPEREVPALVFAQHYAEQNGQPDPATWQRLVGYYGADTARDIMAYIRVITLGNLFGNTFDALLSRLAGKPARGSSLGSELAVVGLGIGIPLAAAGAVLLAAYLAARKVVGLVTPRD